MIEQAHYAGVVALDEHIGPGDIPEQYLVAYIEALGVLPDHHAQVHELLLQFWSTPGLDWWRYELPGSREGLRALYDAGHTVAIISNANGRVEQQLLDYGICQVGEGVGTPVRAIIDSHVFGVEKPDPRIFHHVSALLGLPPERCVYVGDTVRYDVQGARAAGSSRSTSTRSASAGARTCTRIYGRSQTSQGCSSKRLDLNQPVPSPWGYGAGLRAGSTSRAQSLRFHSGSGASTSTWGTYLRAFHQLVLVDVAWAVREDLARPHPDHHLGTRVLRQERVGRVDAGRAVQAQPPPALQVKEQQPDVRVDQRVPRREVHPVAVIAREGDGVIIHDPHEAGIAALVRAVRAALSISGCQEQHVARLDELAVLVADPLTARRRPLSNLVGQPLTVEPCLQLTVAVVEHLGHARPPASVRFDAAETVPPLDVALIAAVRLVLLLRMCVRRSVRSPLIRSLRPLSMDMGASPMISP